MLFSLFLRVVLACGSISRAQSYVHRLDSRQQSPTSQSTEPCAQLAAIVNPLKAANPKGPSPMVSGQLAFDCLNSVPLHRWAVLTGWNLEPEAMGVAGAILPYVRFQSDLAYKRNPPAGYQMKPVDVIESLTRIVDNLTSNLYPNEYSWQADTFRVFNTAKDGHFRFVGDLLAKVARFQRQIALVSVSMDGVGLPQIYMLDDINKMQALGQSFKPSVVTQINGQEAVSFMEKESDLGFQQDMDTAYNTLFFSPASNFNPSAPFQYGFFGGDSRYGLNWPGSNTTVTFANSSTMVIPTMAKIIGNLTGIVDGESLYQRFCNPISTPIIDPTPASNVTAPKFTALPSPDKVKLNGYPKPRAIASDLQVSGYYLNKTGYEDVGVIAMQSFSPEIPSEFQAVVQTMLAEMKRDGKTKVIVDLSVNGGGSVLQGFDTFRQFFPTIQDQSMARMRVQPALVELAQGIAGLLPNPLSAANGTNDQIALTESHFNFGFDRSLAGKHFNSVAEKFNGPAFNGDNFTNLFQFDFNDSILTTNESTGLGMEITGYGSRTNFTQPFPAENIVMLYDGQCASTCTIFSEMMRIQGGVKSIAMGGRPSTSQIQAIGGVKGSGDNTYEDIFQFADFLVQTTPQNFTATGSTKLSNLAAITSLPQNRSLDTSINIQDQILPGNFKDGIPAQFVNEPADCRIFYTPEMVVDIQVMWEAAADAAFKGKACVVGGISAGMGKRIIGGDGMVEVRKREMPRLRREAQDARVLLEVARGKTLKRVKGWAGVHGRMIPTLDAL